MLDSNTVYHYTVTKPSGEKYRLFFDYHKDPRSRLSDINDLLDEDSLSYCNENWITFNSGGYGVTPEDKTKRFLEGLANAILYEDRVVRESILQKEKIEEIINNEIHMDSFFDDYEKPEDLESCIVAINKLLEDTAKDDGKIIQPQQPIDKVAERRKKRTKIDKFNDIYGRPSSKCIDYVEDNRLPYMPKYWSELEINIEPKNFIVDKSKEYKVDWVNVNVNRVFVFDNKKFRISKDAKQYLYAGHTKRYETYRDDFKMIKVLCFEQHGKYYFYDEGIDSITNLVEILDGGETDEGGYSKSCTKFF